MHKDMHKDMLKACTKTCIKVDLLNSPGSVQCARAAASYAVCDRGTTTLPRTYRHCHSADTPLSCPVGTPTKVREGCSRTTVLGIGETLPPVSSEVSTKFTKPCP